MNTNTTQNIVSKALQPGEETSEFQVMQSAVSSGNVWTIIGAILAIGASGIELLSATPFAQTKWGVYIIAGFGALVTIFGVIQKVRAQTQYIEGRSVIKAASMNHLAPEISNNNTTNTTNNEAAPPKI